MCDVRRYTKKLEVFERTILRKTFVSINELKIWSSRYNHEVFKKTSISEFVRIEDDKPPKRARELKVGRKP